MRSERGYRRAGTLLRACALYLLLAGCGDDDGACIPPSLVGTCVAQLSSESQMCFDAEGSCTWADTDAGITFEWKNGARYEFGTDEDIRFFSSGGDECIHVTPIEKDDCNGFRDQVGARWVNICPVPNSGTKDIQAVEYRCDNGRKYRVPYSTLMANANMCMTAAPDILRCVDKDGVEFGKQ